MAGDKVGAARRSVPSDSSAAASYVLDHQIGFVLRLVSQRHTTIFAQLIGDDDLTPTQWAALAKLWQTGPTSQNQLGRLTAMDAATIRGVVARLMKRGLVDTRPDKTDARRLLVGLTRKGAQIFRALAPRALEITEATLAPLNAEERATLTRLLDKLR